MGESCGLKKSETPMLGEGSEKKDTSRGKETGINMTTKETQGFASPKDFKPETVSRKGEPTSGTDGNALPIRKRRREKKKGRRGISKNTRVLA